MATQAHCAYCFETLSANLENREALSLKQVEELWKQFNADPSAPDPNAPEDETADNEDAHAAPDGSPPIPAAIARLLAPSPATTSSSSVQSTSSTPSGVSEASSATSKSSSRSSLLSRAQRKEESPTATPLFVTWNTVAKPNGARLSEKRLRGCIGTFESQQLDRGLRQYAIISALEDTRFNPITSAELPTLECGVTLLTDFEPITEPFDWDLGTHGLRISFTHHGRRYGSTYLPDVAKEQGWTKEETLISLMRKAGWSGRGADWKKVELNVVRYQGRQVRLGQREWEEWRRWVDEDDDDDEEHEE